MATGDVADSIGHRENRQAERKGNAEEANAQLRKSGREDCCPTTAEGKPERTEEFSRAPS
jgi:hypothetical protein